MKKVTKIMDAKSLMSVTRSTIWAVLQGVLKLSTQKTNTLAIKSLICAHIKANLIILFFLFPFVTLFAGEEDGKEQEKERIKIIRYERITKIDFNELLLSGELKKPSGFVILKRANVKFQGLIKLRKDFDKELEGSLLIIGY